VAENEGKWMPRRHAIKREPNVGVAYAAPGNFDDNFVWTGGEAGELAPLKGAVGHLQLKTVPALNACHR
jgi:hypothetical protein